MPCWGCGVIGVHDDMFWMLTRLVDVQDSQNFFSLKTNSKFENLKWSHNGTHFMRTFHLITVLYILLFDLETVLKEEDDCSISKYSGITLYKYPSPLSPGIDLWENDHDTELFPDQQTIEISVTEIEINHSTIFVMSSSRNGDSEGTKSNGLCLCVSLQYECATVYFSDFPQEDSEWLPLHFAP